MKEKEGSDFNSFAIILIFCLAIFIPFIVGIIEEDKTFSLVEKRTLAPLVHDVKGINDICSFPKSFGKYYSDHFGLREWLTKNYKIVKYSIGDSTSEDVTIGKNGWLFLGSIKNGPKDTDDPIGDARNVNLYSQQELEKLALHMVGINSWLKEQGIKYLFFIAPDKHTIYSEQLPDYLSKVGSKSAADQLFQYIGAYTDVHLVDLRDALIREKTKNTLYYQTGTHWNFMGGNIAQYEIMKTVQKLFPTRISPELYESSIFKYKVATDRGLEGLMGINFKPPVLAPYPVFELDSNIITDYPKGPNGEVAGRALRRVTRTNINPEQKLRAVIFRDSFFRVLEPYFKRKFKRSTLIWKPLNYLDLVEYIKREKPDIIIEELAERKLPYVPKSNFEFTKSLH